MHLIFIFCNIIVLFKNINASSLHSYLPSESLCSDNDPGEALYLTKYIENGDIETAQKLALVNHPDIAIKSYAGYLTVNETFNSNMFFWFFPAKNDPEQAPIMLWLDGGPGSPTLFSLVFENGPYNLSPRLELTPRQYSWQINHNMLYIDNPVGTGYSYSEDAGYSKNDIDIGRNLLVALHQFFVLFPQFQQNEFFVGGQSYGGKFVPAIGYAIYQESKRKTIGSMKPKINLKGLLIGNGWSDPIHQLNYADYLYQLGLIDTKGHAAFVKLQNQCIDCLKIRDFKCGFEIFDRLVLGVNFKYGSLLKNWTGFETFHSALNNPNENFSFLDNFAESSETRQAIHVGNNTFHGTEIENDVLDHLELDFMSSVAHWVSELLSHYPMLIFNSQLDIVIAYPLTENYLKNLEFSGADEYKTAERHIWRVDNEIAGYVKQAGNLTEVLIRNAGHDVLLEQPKWALDMLERFTLHKGFDEQK